MTPPEATADGKLPPPSGPSEASGPFFGIGLPKTLAAGLAGQRQVVAVEPDAIATAGLDQVDNAEVGCLLMGGEVDALDIIADLSKAGYRGQVTVISPPVPDPLMIERELMIAGKSMKITIVVRES